MYDKTCRYYGIGHVDIIGVFVGMMIAYYVGMMQESKSYTMELLESMANGLIESKLSHGFTRLQNGLLEDVVGNVFAIDLKQETVTDAVTLEPVSVIKFTCRKVDVVGRL